jgi:hypothetical protein
MDGADTKDSDVAPVLEHAKRHDWRLGKLPLVDEKQDHGEDTHNDETKNRARIPRVADSTEFQAEQEHKDTTDDEQSSNPINSFKPFPERGSWCLQVEEEEDDDECCSIKRQVDVETPSP